MKKNHAFQKYTEKYDQWFDENRPAYEAELRAVGSLLPDKRNGIEIGAGTGRFAVPLGVKLGVEPSLNMGGIAKNRGIHLINAYAENLPLKNAAFDFVLMVTAICFLDDVHKAFLEANRILKRTGYFIVGMIDRQSYLGRLYSEKQNKSVFYKNAHFYSVNEIIQLMRQSGFNEFLFRQALFKNHEAENVKKVVSGYGEGAFVVIRGRKRR
ncbi:MAG: class I SAM-dependent methyltransferase [Candidatus Aureabacteria bacterium]|nr:class I SAM-dependent methyltransferase [Candidatus Auribacterota bacterium]